MCINQQDQIISELTDVESNICYLVSGVTQEPILGPHMFLIYTDDIVDDMECLINLFADDTSVQQQITDITTFYKVNRDLQRVTVLGEQWLIEFKAIKTECRENEPHPDPPTPQIAQIYY